MLVSSIHINNRIESVSKRAQLDMVTGCLCNQVKLLQSTITLKLLYNRLRYIPILTYGLISLSIQRYAGIFVPVFPKP